QQSWPGMGEDGPLAQYDGPDPMKWTVEALRSSTQALYAPLKVLSEKETQKWFPGKFVIIRPGLIVGPGDESDRFTYWAVRVARGGEVLTPGDPKKDAVQFIDARDLAEWTIRMVEQGDTGIYNAVGFKEKLLMSQMLDDIKSATKSDAQFTWVNIDFLLEQKIHAWYDMPVWVAPKGPESGFSNLSNKKALTKGISFRPVSDTALATLEWFQNQSPQRQATLRSGISSARESQILAAWHAKHK
ncbi:MAG TPA: NAD-dependent epimerase/dehydratase family protein, partial [Pyrinomonadaceae bacterium]|nr:NAD-dependent epimerase/dehydratase family protein [Pyrinomonadaceae bacterium]